MRTWPALDIGPLAHPDLFQAALLDYGVAAVDETTQPDAWRVFFSTDAERDAAAAGLSRQFPGTHIRPLDLPDEDWVARSQASLCAVTIGNTIVAPPWDLPPDPALVGRLPAPLVIVIRPSMGFGTGHHATTRLCLMALQQIDLNGSRVLDVGTGSGLLAIAASRFGAAQVVAIDDDADACRAAEENVSLNPGAAVTVRRADVRTIAMEAFDVVLANLTGALLQNAATRMRDLSAPGGQVILSGFMQTEEAEVLGAYSGFSTTARTEEDEWLCVTLRRS
jgi:ribosomal protein L11 methyltransferase